MSRPEIDQLIQKIAELVVKDPQKAAIILTAWMASGARGQATAPPQASPKKKAG